MGGAGSGRVFSCSTCHGPHSSEVGRRLCSSGPGAWALYSELTIFTLSPYTGIPAGILTHWPTLLLHEYRELAILFTLQPAPRSYLYQALLPIWHAAPPSKT